MSTLQGKRVLITGGSSGIGKATAKLAVQRGATVCIAARGKEALEQTRQELLRDARGGEEQVQSVVMDISQREQVNEVAKEIQQRLGGIDLLINNAGIAHVGYLEQETPEAYQRMIDVNYLGSVWVTQAFLPQFMAQRQGNIAFVSSVLGLMGLFGYSAYCGSKHALTGYADALRQDLLRYNIQVSVLFPADTDTPQLQEENQSKPPETASLAGTIKTADPDDVARCFLDGIAGGRYHIIPGHENRLTLWGVRHFPWLARQVIDRDLRKFWRRSTPG